MLVEKISQTGNKMDRISQYTKYLNNGKEDVVIEEEEILDYFTMRNVKNVMTLLKNIIFRGNLRIIDSSQTSNK